MADLQGTDLAKQLAADDAAGKVGPEFKGHYTVIVPGAVLAHWLTPASLDCPNRRDRG